MEIIRKDIMARGLDEYLVSVRVRQILTREDDCPEAG